MWIVVLDVLAQALFAVRADNLATLDPTIGPRNLVHKTSAGGNVFLCTGVNFSPTSLLCRLNGGFVHWTLQRVLVWGLIALLALWVAQVLRGRRALSWDTFAFVCAISIMLSPLSWAHYQVMLLPLFVLTLVRLTEDGTLAGVNRFLSQTSVQPSTLREPSPEGAPKIQHRDRIRARIT